VFALIWGDGSDGTGTFDGTATPAGVTKSGSTYTIVRDVYYTDATVSNAVTVKTNGYRIYCTGTLTISASCFVENNGTDASGTTPGVGGPAGSLRGGKNGATSWTAGGAEIAGPGGEGGNSGDYDVSYGYGLGSQNFNVATIPQNLLFVSGLMRSFYNAPVGYDGGGGGAISDMAGGGGGGLIGLYAKVIVNNGTIRALGGNAANGGQYGGGGGGGGGVLVISTSTQNGTITLTGGAGGQASSLPGYAGEDGRTLWFTVS
jgi:hypothetical protein